MEGSSEQYDPTVAEASPISSRKLNDLAAENEVKITLSVGDGRYVWERQIVGSLTEVPLYPANTPNVLLYDSRLAAYVYGMLRQLLEV